MKIFKLHSLNPRFPIGLFAVLFIVFAMSSWNIRTARDGFDAGNVTELTETAHTGSLYRQLGLTVLAIYAVYNLVAKRLPPICVNWWSGAAFLLLIVWTSASMMWSIDNELTARGLARFLVICLGAFVVGRMVTIRQLAKVTFYLSALTLICSIGVEIAANDFVPSSPAWRFSGLMHPVSQAWNCSMLAISAVFLSSCGRRRIWYPTVAFFAIAFLVLTKSRLAFASTLLTICVFYLLRSTRTQRVVTIALSCSALCLVLLADGHTIQKLIAFGRGDDGQSSVESLTGRVPLWKDCLRYIRKRPLAGYGYNTFLSENHTFMIYDASGWMSSPHSGYVEMLLELGIVGLALLVATLSCAVCFSFSRLRSDPEQRLVVSVLIWLVVNLTLESFLITSPFYATFLAVTLVSKMSFSSRDELYSAKGSALAEHQNRRLLSL
jgi:exopolysaccharide production protein ExoQ